MDSVGVELCVRTLSDPSVAPVLTASLGIQDTLVLILMNAPLSIPSVLLPPYAPTLLDPSLVYVHLVHLVTLSSNAHLSHHLIPV